VGIVSAEVRALVVRQVQEYGVVVWFDPEAHYTDLPAMLGGDIHVESFDSSFFELRRRIDNLNLMRREKPPTLVVYVPRERSQTHNALAELVAAGVELSPGLHPASVIRAYPPSPAARLKPCWALMALRRLRSRLPTAS
jgi:hypothetical protein